MIRQAILSCLASSYSVEVISVNDGSNDHTGEVMDSCYISENPRQVKVVHLSQNVGKRKAIREGIVIEQRAIL